MTIYQMVNTPLSKVLICPKFAPNLPEIRPKLPQKPCWPLTTPYQMWHNAHMRNENRLWEAQVREGIRLLMYKRGISVAALARRLETPQSTLWNFLTGKSPFRKPYAIAIAHELGVSLERLAELGTLEIEPTQEQSTGGAR